jgi:hypothetical protein
MTTTFQKEAAGKRGSAKIFEFPARGRVASRSGHEKSSAAPAASTQAADIVCDGAWYHEEAIQDGRHGRAS